MSWELVEFPHTIESGWEYAMSLEAEPRMYRRKPEKMSVAIRCRRCKGLGRWLWCKRCFNTGTEVVMEETDAAINES